MTIPADAPPTRGAAGSAGAAEAARRAREEDAALVEAGVGGDREALAKLFERYREKVYRVVYGYVHDRDDALDLTQEAFIKAFRNLKSFAGRSSFYTWLTQIAINLSIDFRRRRMRRQTLPLEDYMTPRKKIAGARSPPDPRLKAEEREMRERYLAALEQISEKHRSVFLLHTVEGLAYKEIAQVLEISIGTVMSRLHYARKHLQRLLKGVLGSGPGRETRTG